jgi:hypothetical protein
MAKFCERCGNWMEDSDVFCQKCGAAYQKPQQAPFQPQPPAYTPPRQTAYPPQQPPYKPAQYGGAYAPPQKKRTGLITGIAIGASVLVIAAVGITWAALSKGGGQKTDLPIATATATPAPVEGVELIPFPDELKVDKGSVNVHCTYTPPEYIIPANYRSLDAVITIKCYTDTGSTKLLVSAEIPEFTQKYEQMVDVSRAETTLKIHPPLLENAARSLNSSRDAQLVVNVKDLNSGKIVVQDTKPVKLYSRYDMQWEGKDGAPFYENILAWMTPEAPEIDQMLRLSADSLGELTGGGMDFIVGYQEVKGLSHAQITYAQTCAMMHTMAAKFNVKYIMAPFSATSSDLQSIKTPAEVLNNAGGLCIETALTMASAIERTNMHAVIILLPGHAQVAVETWYGSGEYLLVETTALSAAASGNFDDVVVYLDKGQWKQYLTQPGYAAIDCDLAEKLNIKSID